MTFRNFMVSKENLFEANPKYEQAMIEIFNKAVKDELEASINYKIMAEQIQGPGINQIKTELEKHGEEEYKHFTEFIAYASDHSILNNITFEIDSDNVNPMKLPQDVQSIVAFSQDLEKKAYEDYKAAAQLATDNGDNETRMFFERLMADEMTHFDDISDLDSTGSIRKFGE